MPDLIFLREVLTSASDESALRGCREERRDSGDDEGWEMGPGRDNWESSLGWGGGSSLRAF